MVSGGRARRWPQLLSGGEGVLHEIRNLVIAATMLALSAPSAAAQFPARVQPGVRVRVWLPEAYQQENGPWRRQLLRATVADVANDTLRLVVAGTAGSLTVARANIRRLDVSRGTSRVASAFERAFAFAVVGAISIALDNDPGGSEWPHYNRDWRAAEEGAKWGAALGAVVGFVLPTERWHRVRVR
jgi:hypothetical protein